MSKKIIAAAKLIASDAEVRRWLLLEALLNATVFVGFYSATSGILLMVH